MTTLPEPSFVDRDGTVILNDSVARFEALVGRPLEPSQVERLLLDVLAYRETLVRIAIQEAAKQNLVAYALYPMIDLLGELGGGVRLEAQSARTTLRWTLPEVRDVTSPIPVGTRTRSHDKRVDFVTLADVVIDIGATTVDVAAECSTAAQLGNGYLAGQIADLISVLPFDVSVTNLTETSGGSFEETTDAFRERLPLVIQGSSVAGPERAYERIARGAHPDIVSVRVTSPDPGIVRVGVLAIGDSESSDLLDLVEEACSSVDVRPLTDTVEIQGTTRVDYSLDAQLTLYAGVAPDAVVAAALGALAEYTDGLARAHGRAPVLSKILRALEVAGVQSAVLADPDLPAVDATDAARCASLAVSVAGFSTELPP